MTKAGAATATAAIMIATIALIIVGAFALFAWQQDDCRDRGGHWQPTSGFQGLRVSDDGRILP